MFGTDAGLQSDVGLQSAAAVSTTASVLGPASHTSNLFHLPSPGSFGLLKNDYTSKASPLGQSIPSPGVLLRCTRSVESKEWPREDR